MLVDVVEKLVSRVDILSAHCAIRIETNQQQILVPGSQNPLDTDGSGDRASQLLPRECFLRATPLGVSILLGTRTEFFRRSTCY